MTSLWLAHAPSIPTDPFEPGAGFDEVVVGAGLTGLVTAVMLAREGRSVAVVDARTVGAVATGNTTAKLSLLQGTHLTRIREAMYPAVVRAYVDGNRAGFDWLLAYLDANGVPYDRRRSVTYAETMDDAPAVVPGDPGLPLPTSTQCSGDNQDETAVSTRVYNSTDGPVYVYWISQAEFGCKTSFERGIDAYAPGFGPLSLYVNGFFVVLDAGGQQVATFEATEGNMVVIK